MAITFFNKKTFVSFLILPLFINSSGFYRAAYKNQNLHPQETTDVDIVSNAACDDETPMEELLNLNRKKYGGTWENTNAIYAESDNITETVQTLAEYPAAFQDTPTITPAPKPTTTPTPTPSPTPKPASSQVKVNGVPMILQKPELPTGCEITSAAMALRYLGVNTDKIALANEIPKSPLPHTVDGKLVGDSPNNTFIGSPFSSSGLGVYHTPIFNLMAKYTSNVKDITGSSFDTLKNYLKQGKAIVVWSSISMTAVADGGGWYVDGQYFHWKKNEHCMVLVGYTSSRVIVNDPLKGVANYSISAFINAYNTLGKQAILINK